MKVIIVEDDFIVADHLKLILEKHKVKVLGIVDNLEEAIESMVLKPDLYFVDIRLEGVKTGIDLAVELQKHKMPFIYLSANNELQTVKLAAKTNPISYITKPYNEIDIVAVLELFKSKFELALEVRTKFGKKKIKFSDIRYFEAEGSYVKIFTTNETFTDRYTLTDLEQILNEDFVRVHRSFIVNRTKVTEYNSSKLYLGKTEVPISRSYKGVI